MTRPDQTTDQTSQTTAAELLPLAEAAARLGIHVDALRSRIRRGQVYAVRDGRRWLVSLTAQPDQLTRPDATSDQTRPDHVTSSPTDHDALVETLRSEVTFLRAELERRGVELAEMRRLLAMATPALPAPVAAESAENAPVAAEPAQTAPRRRWAFWRR